LKTLRTIVFLPAGLLAAAPAGILGKVITESFGLGFAAWFVAGTYSAVAFFLVGFRVGPRDTPLTMRCLVLTEFSLIACRNLSVLFGIAVTLVGIAFAKEELR
jgi:hypothetical protein